MSVDLDKKAEPDLDAVISDVGEFGQRQIVHFILLCVPIALSTTLLLNFLFTSATLDYRCKVPECESPAANGHVNWQPEWQSHAIPQKNNRYEKCRRYIGNETAAASMALSHGHRDACPAELFSPTDTISCAEFVFKTEEVGISNEFGLLCDNEYRLAMVGVTNNVARFVFMPLAGILSDKFGRLRMLIWGMMASGVGGILQSFSTSYIMFLALEFITAGVGTAIYGSGFVLGAEWVSSKYRVLTSIIVAGTVPLGEITLAVCAMYFPNFRSLLLVIFAPCLLVFVYHWLVPESTRWLYVVGRYDQAENDLKKMARSNKTEVPQESYDAVRTLYQSLGKKEQQHTANVSFSTIFADRKLIVRFISLSFCWMVNSFVFYGIGIFSTRLQGDANKHLSFIIVSFFELPGTFAVLLLLDRCGRRATVCGGLTLSGVAIILSTVVPTEHKSIIILLFIIGKSATICSFISLYVYTTELWPTCLRGTMMNMCSTVGRLGAIFAAAVVLLTYIMPELPFILFGASALLSAALICFNPETNGRKLPDTLDDIKDFSS